MVYLKQIKLINPDEVSGPVEDLKYPYKAAAVRYMDELVFTRPVTFLVGENGIGKSTLLEAVMYKYERRNEDLQGMLNDGDESHKVLANVLPDQIRLVEVRKPDDYFFSVPNLFRPCPRDRCPIDARHPQIRTRLLHGTLWRTASAGAVAR